MALPKLFTFIGGKIKAAVLAIQVSTGAPDADKLVATGADGKIDLSFMPSGIGASTVSATASEALSAGAYVDLYNDGTGLKVRNADAATLKPANGFVLASVASGAVAAVYSLGELNTQHTGLTPGADYWLSVTTPGAVQTSAPSATGQLYQRVGVATSTTQMLTASDVAVEIG